METEKGHQSLKNSIGELLIANSWGEVAKKNSTKTRFELARPKPWHY